MGKSKHDQVYGTILSRPGSSQVSQMSIAFIERTMTGNGEKTREFTIYTYPFRILFGKSAH